MLLRPGSESLDDKVGFYREGRNEHPSRFVYLVYGLSWTPNPRKDPASGSPFLLYRFFCWMPLIKVDVETQPVKEQNYPQSNLNLSLPCLG